MSEVCAVAGLVHSNVVQVHDVVRSDDGTGF